MTAQARLLGGRYQVGELLGYGGMAEVHRGRDNRLGRDVAIKMLRADLARDDTFQLRFRREAQNAASLNHPAIVAVYDTGEERGPSGETLPYIVMEFVNGRTLKEVLAAEGRLMPRRAMDITAEICAALEFSHRHGIIHRDIKPGNVMLNQSGQVKVMDFGIARALASGAQTMTQTSAVIGTAQYLSPEQARGEAVDARSDVYATGCVLYELLCGQPPFIGDSPVSVAYQHVREDAKPPSLINRDVPPPVDAIVLKALTKNPLNRYQSAGEMRADLLRAISGRPVQAEPVMRPEDAAATQALRANTGATRTIPAARVGNARRRRTSGWVIAALTALGVMAVIALTAGLIALSLPKKTTVPNLAGLTKDQANTEITKAKLTPQGTPVKDLTCTENQVLEQTTPAGKEVEVGSTVAYKFCAGRQSVTIPPLIGTSKANAQDQLEKLNLVPDFKTKDSDAPKDQVIAVDPAEGKTIDAGSVVTVTVSKGNLVAVPPVANKGFNEATARAVLNNAGFEKVTAVPVIVDDPTKVGLVVSQDPEGGTKAKRSTPVTIFVGAAETEPPPTSGAPTSPPP
jgi:serine/threonine-protein kinase